MRRLKNFLVVLTTLAWLAGSSHALLQCAGLIHQHHEDHDVSAPGSHEHTADNHEAADGKCLLSPTHVNVPLPDSAGMPIFFYAPGLEWTFALRGELYPSGLPPPGSAPPHLSHRWQFSFRTALPVRAPSLIS